MNYQEAYDKLALFMKPISDEWCSPCKSTNREYNGPFACCLNGCFSNVEKNEGIDYNAINNSIDEKCIYFSNGCSLTKKPLDCLVYMCDGIILTEEQKSEYLRLRSSVYEALNKLYA